MEKVVRLSHDEIRDCFTLETSRGAKLLIQDGYGIFHRRGLAGIQPLEEFVPKMHCGPELLWFVFETEPGKTHYRAVAKVPDRSAVQQWLAAVEKHLHRHQDPVT